VVCRCETCARPSENELDLGRVANGLSGQVLLVCASDCDRIRGDKKVLTDGIHHLRTAPSSLVHKRSTRTPEFYFILAKFFDDLPSDFRLHKIITTKHLKNSFCREFHSVFGWHVNFRPTTGADLEWGFTIFFIVPCQICPDRFRHNNKLRQFIIIDNTFVQDRYKSSH